jgi:hypothetical protein
MPCLVYPRVKVRLARRSCSELHRGLGHAFFACPGVQVRLARRYYAKLYREFCIADLSRHKEGRVGLRWRTQKEVVSGKGQFACGAVVSWVFFNAF